MNTVDDSNLLARSSNQGEELNQPEPVNRRSEPRVALRFPIEVSGFERAGKYFIERTSCLDVGEMSCAFTLRAAVAIDSVVAIRSFHWQNNNVLESRPVLFQIVRLEEGEQGRVVATIRLLPRAKACADLPL